MFNWRAKIVRSQNLMSDQKLLQSQRSMSSSRKIWGRSKMLIRCKNSSKHEQSQRNVKKRSREIIHNDIPRSNYFSLKDSERTRGKVYSRKIISERSLSDVSKEQATILPTSSSEPRGNKCKIDQEKEQPYSFWD